MGRAVWLWLAACGGGAADPAPVAVGARSPVEGTVCDQLVALTTGDPWALPGRDLPGADDVTRTRALDLAPAWADGCTVNRLGGMDVGPSCAATRATPEAAAAVHAPLEEEFRACHAGWTLTDESGGTTRELVAERGTELHFLRLRQEADGAWRVSVGAMPGA